MKAYFFAGIFAIGIVVSGQTLGQTYEQERRLSEMQGPVGDVARERLKNPPMPGEMADDYRFRRELEKAVEAGEISAREAMYIRQNRDLVREIRALREEVEELRRKIRR